jgi:hypothetical protein
MKIRTRAWVGFLPVVAVLMSLAACTGDSSDDEAGKSENDAAVVGSFVGEVSGTEAFVAVVAAPAQGEDDADPVVQVYVADGQGLSEWFSGTISENSFVAMSDEGDAQANGELSSGSATGTVELPDGETVTFEAAPPSGGAGLYELSVSAAGELSGASAAGLAVTGEIPFEKGETGVLRLVDGKRLKFAVTQKRAGDVTHLRAGQVSVIVTDDELRGVAKGRSSSGDRPVFFIRSA